MQLSNNVSQKDLEIQLKSLIVCKPQKLHLIIKDCYNTCNKSGGGGGGVVWASTKLIVCTWIT